jgi:hypothetical protein
MGLIYYPRCFCADLFFQQLQNTRAYGNQDVQNCNCKNSTKYRYPLSFRYLYSTRKIHISDSNKIALYRINMAPTMLTGFLTIWNASDSQQAT